MELSDKKKLAERGLELARLCLLLLAADVAASGSGRYLMIGPFSPRMLLGGLAFAFCLPAAVQDIRDELKNPFHYLVLSFVLWAAVKAVQGLRAGYNMTVWSSDVKGFAWLFLVPVFGIVFRTREDYHRLLSFTLAGASIQAVLSVGMNAVFAGISADLVETALKPVWGWYWGTILAVEYHAFRIFCRGCIYMVLGCGICLTRLVSLKKFRAGYAVLFVLNAEGLILTFTRSIYLTTLLSFLIIFALLLLTCPVKRVLLRTLLLTVLVLAFNYGSELVLKQGNIQYAFARCLHVDLNAKLPLPHTWEQEDIDPDSLTEDSDNTRELTVRGLKELIRRSPLFGCGLGAAGAERDGIDEYFYLDMLARTGILGLILYFLPYLYATLLMIRRREPLKNWPEGIVAFAGLWAFLIASYFNPWMNAALGITWYAAALTVPRILMREERKAA